MKLLYMPGVDDRMGGAKSLVLGVSSGIVLWIGIWLLERIIQ
jgi:hypothetical protein